MEPNGRDAPTLFGAAVCRVTAPPVGNVAGSARDELDGRLEFEVRHTGHGQAGTRGGVSFSLRPVITSQPTCPAELQALRIRVGTGER